MKDTATKNKIAAVTAEIEQKRPTDKPIADWTIEDGVQAIRDFMGALPERFVKAYLQAESRTDAADLEDLYDQEIKDEYTQVKKENAEHRAEVKRIPPSVELINAYRYTVCEFHKMALDLREDADECDHHPDITKRIYTTSINAACHLLQHANVAPGEMVEFYEDYKEFAYHEATQQLFAMDRLYHYTFEMTEAERIKYAEENNQGFNVYQVANADQDAAAPLTVSLAHNGGVEIYTAMIDKMIADVSHLNTEKDNDRLKLYAMICFIGSELKEVLNIAPADMVKHIPNGESIEHKNALNTLHNLDNLHQVVFNR